MKFSQCKIKCLNCKNNFYVKNYRKYEAKYCSKKCRKAYYYKHKRKNICNYCLKEFIKSHNPNREYKFCSIKCVGKYLTASKPQLEKLCKHCNKSYLIKFKSKQKYCSKLCSDLNKTKKINKTCLNCNNIFNVIFSRKDKAIYCSKLCYGLSKRKYGEDLESIRKSPEYKEWRKTVLIRDNYTCVLCKSKNVKLHVDHIKQFAFYPDLRFNIDNGRVLCVKCHRKTDTYGNRSKIRSGV